MEFLKRGLYLLILLTLLSCNGEFLEKLPHDTKAGGFCPNARLANGYCPDDQQDLVWDFLNSANYNFNSNYVEISSGQASLKTVDQTFAGADFSSGTHVGTYYDSSSKSIKVINTDQSSIVNILASKVGNILNYYRFEGGASASVGTDGILNDGGSGLSAVDGKISGGLDFDGVDDNISFTTPTMTGFSASLWVKIDSYPNNYPRLLSIANDRFSVWVSNTSNAYGTVTGSIELRARHDGSGTKGFWFTPDSKISLGQWHHIAFSYDSTSNANEPLLIVDGQTQNLSTRYPADGTFDDTNGTSYIGDWHSGVPRNVDGTFDEFALFDTTLNETELKSIYSAQASQHLSDTGLHSSWTPQWNHIVGYWKMDGNWQDSSGNGNHSTSTEGGIGFSGRAKVGSDSGSFDGDDDIVRLGSIANTDPLALANSAFSISFWLNAVDSPDEFARIFDKSTNTSGTNGYSLVIQKATHRIRMYIDGSNAGASPVDSLKINQWTHFVFSYSSSKRAFYVDGVKVDEVTAGGYSLPPNTTANASIGSWNHSNAREYEGDLDDLAVWNTDLSDQEVLTVYNRQKQKYAGHYESPIMDLGASGSWTNLDAITTLPFGKEIFSQTSESSSDYSSLSGNLSSGLVAYWPLNEATTGLAPGGADNENKVSNNYHGTQSGGPAIINAPLGRGVYFDGADDYIQIPTMSEGTTVDFTTAAWVNVRELSHGRHYILDLRGDGSTMQDSVALWLDSAGVGIVDFRCYISYSNNASLAEYKTTTTYPISKWHHVSCNRSGTSVTIYVNGKAAPTVYSSGTGVLTNDPVSFDLAARIGRYSGNGGAPNYLFSGSIDEVAIWNRALSTTEVQQLYRRGANRIKYQIKSCVDSTCNCKSYNVAPAGSATDCDGDGILNTVDTDDSYMADFIGPGGNGATSYSELFNRAPADIVATCTLNTTDSDNDICMDDEITLTGDTLNTPPSFVFSNMAASASPANNRYFQYKVIMEAEENTACAGSPCMPELTSVEVGPTGRYYAGSPVISPKTPISYTNINQLTFSQGGSCDLTYQLSPDGVTYYYHNGTAWVVAASELASLSSSAAVTSANIKTFTSTAGAGSLYFKAFMTSDTTESCGLDKINLINVN